jgi:hypothetical protein
VNIGYIGSSGSTNCRQTSYSPITLVTKIIISQMIVSFFQNILLKESNNDDMVLQKRRVSYIWGFSVDGHTRIKCWKDNTKARILFFLHLCHYFETRFLFVCRLTKRKGKQIEHDDVVLSLFALWHQIILLVSDVGTSLMDSNLQFRKTRKDGVNKNLYHHIKWSHKETENIKSCASKMKFSCNNNDRHNKHIS